MRAPAAVFDLDGTLTRRDTLLPFLLHVLGPRRFWTRVPSLAPHLRDNTALKRAIVRRMLHDVPDDALAAGGLTFASRIDAWLRADAVRCLRWHQARGHRTALVSASFEAYVLPWGRRHGFDTVLATRVRRDVDPTDVDNCHGPAKLARLRSAWGPLDEVELHAYGDSSGDRALLDAASRRWYRSFPEHLP